MTRATVVLAALLGALAAQSGAAGASDAGPAPLPARWPSDRLELGLTSQPGDPQPRPPLRFRYQYLAGGVNTGDGWATWNPNGTFVTRYIAETHARRMTPVFTYYVIRQSRPGRDVGDEARADLGNLREVATMRAFYADLRLFFRRAGAFRGRTVILHVEPDLWGYVQQRARGDRAASVPAAVASTGLADLRGLPNHAGGVARAVVRLRDRYARNVLLGYHASIWGTNTDIGLQDPPGAQVDRLAARAAAFARSLGARWDLAFAEFDDRDSGFNDHVLGDRGASWWRAADFARHVRFLRGFTRRAGLRVVLWQIPLGNTHMRAMNDTPGHYRDNRVQWLLDDPRGSHLRAYRDAGVIALLFGGGAEGTTCACDARRDGVTNPAPIGGNTRRSLSADDDGGFFDERAAAYHRAGGLPL